MAWPVDRRNKAYRYRRGRFGEVPAPQDTPLAFVRPSRRPARFSVGRRSRGSWGIDYFEVVPPQVPVPSPVFPVTAATRRAKWMRPRRGVVQQQVIPQPPAPEYPEIRATKRAPWLRPRRGRFAETVPAQVPVPSPVFPLVDATRRAKWLRPRLGRFVEPGWPQAIQPNPPVAPDWARSRTRRWIVPRRGKFAIPVPAQVPVPDAAPLESVVRATKRAPWLRPRRGKFAEVVPAQVPVPVFPPPAVAAVRRGKSVPRRARFAQPTWPQVATPDGIRSRTRRWVLPRRARTAQVVPPQVPIPDAAPLSVVVRAVKRAPWLRPRRGRFAEPVPPQVPIPDPAPVLSLFEARRRSALRPRRGGIFGPVPDQAGAVAPISTRRRPVRTRIGGRFIAPPVAAPVSYPFGIIARVTRKVARPARGRFIGITPAQDAPIRLSTGRRTAIRPRRGTAFGVVRAQDAPVVAVAPSRRQKWTKTTRGRVPTPVPPQVPVPSPVFPVAQATRRARWIRPRGLVRRIWDGLYPGTTANPEGSVTLAVVSVATATLTEVGPTVQLANKSVGSVVLTDQSPTVSLKDMPPNP